jgi:hypothetical protein
MKNCYDALGYDNKFSKLKSKDKKKTSLFQNNLDLHAILRGILNIIYLVSPNGSIL